MPESPEDLYARIVEAVGADGRLPMPAYQEWDAFPWEVVDGRLEPKVVRPPVAAEEPRWGESPDKPCGTCAAPQRDHQIWENDRWFVSRFPEPRGLPLVLFLMSQEHLDFPEIDDDLAGEFGRLSARLCRAMSDLPHIGRVHVSRFGDGGSHLHVWFLARPERLPGLLGSLVVEWDEILPPPPAEVWADDCRTVATALAAYDGRSLLT